MANEEKSIKIYRDFQFNFFSSLADFDFPVFSFFCIAYYVFKKKYVKCILCEYAQCTCVYMFVQVLAMFPLIFFYLLGTRNYNKAKAEA